MNDQEAPRGKMRIVTPDDRIVKLKRLVTTLVIICALALVTGVFVARTEGARSFVESRLEKETGVKLTVKKVRIGLPYVLVLEDVETEGHNGANNCAVQADEIRLGLTGQMKKRVTVTRGALTLQQDVDGHWKPAFFGCLGNLPFGNISDISKITEGFRKHTVLSIVDSTITWHPQKSEKTSAGGVSFDVQAVEMPGGRMYYHSLSVHSMVCANGGLSRMMAQDISREWLAGDAVDYLEIKRSGSAPIEVSDFWEAIRRRQ